jgi:lipopolysaccharide assembly protein A
MKSQWIIVCGLGLALLTAIVAVFNTEEVPLDYLAGQLQVSLIVVISASVLVGGLIVAVFGMVRPYRLQKDRDKLDSSNQELRTENEALRVQLNEAQAAYTMMKRERGDVFRGESIEATEKSPSLDGSSNEVYPRSWDPSRLALRNKSN